MSGELLAELLVGEWPEPAVLTGNKHANLDLLQNLEDVVEEGKVTLFNVDHELDLSRSLKEALESSHCCVEAFLQVEQVSIIREDNDWANSLGERSGSRELDVELCHLR